MGREINLMNRETLLIKLRQQYKEKNVNELKRALTLWHYFLLDEDKIKIQKAIQHLEYTQLTENEVILINKAKKELT